ncbi:hypothetical protein BN381_70033 [Candidatus Microthrix parvicella RN1]|uniref:Uncharacterized protein n=1 Tax=Candidatus Neomicrothrix parvicella RN1 TaxID=1229780 RepID=R4Z356_9ACTN|nr:hypothetical protein BN381_70033 [Candidatus Microthrix parvicella RN1]
MDVEVLLRTTERNPEARPHLIKNEQGTIAPRYLSYTRQVRCLNLIVPKRHCDYTRNLVVAVAKQRFQDVEVVEVERPAILPD